MLPAVDLHENFIDIERIAEALVISLQSPGVYCSKLETLEADRFAADDDASFGQEIFDIAMAQVESVIKPNGTTDDIGWEPVTFVNIHEPILAIFGS